MITDEVSRALVELTKGFYRKTPQAPSPRTGFQRSRCMQIRQVRPATTVEPTICHSGTDLRKLGACIQWSAIVQLSFSQLRLQLKCCGLAVSIGFGASLTCKPVFQPQEQSMQYAVPVGRICASIRLCGKYEPPRYRQYCSKASPLMSR